MEPIVAAAVLGAALLHASWHALVKTSGDPVTALAGMNLVSGACALAVVPFVSLPNANALAVIAFSVLLHVGYKIALARLYTRADLSIAYPLSRGLTPVLATLLGFTLMGERPNPIAAVGVAAICVGILCVVAGRELRGAPWQTLGAALATGTAVAAYSAVDAYGVRVSGEWLAYTAWLVGADSLVFVSYAIALRGRAATGVWRRTWGTTLVSGLLGTASFGVFLWALGRAQVGPVAALRETSIVFAALIGMVLMRERATAVRLVSMILVTSGAVFIAVGR